MAMRVSKGNAIARAMMISMTCALTQGHGVTHARAAAVGDVLVRGSTVARV